jgi:hypothetical protein
MSAANALICAVLFYGFLVLIGRATISLCRHQADPLETHAISPAIGLAVITLLTTYLILLGIPLGPASKNIALSIAILAAIRLASGPGPGFEKKGILTQSEYFVPLLSTALLVVLPFIIGGYQFAILRGNGTDAFNYVTMADGLSRFPLDWILAQTKETLSAQSPNLSLAQDLLKSRWSTSALLAFASGAFGISPVEFEHAFTLTLMVVLFNSLVGALSATRSLTRLTVWLPVVFVVGFWGQFTLDIRAFSQIASLPILVTLIGWLLSHADRPFSIFRYGVSLTAILLCALFFQYPEIVVAFLPGAGLIFLIRLWMVHKASSLTKEDVRAVVAVSFATLLFSSPIIKFVVGFALEQGRFAVNKSLGWEGAYFAWMKNPIRGLWGAGVDPGLGLRFDNGFAVVAFLTALGLTLGVAVRAAMLVSTRTRVHGNLPETGLLLLAASGLIGCGVLVARENIWAAGKVLSYFAILIPIWMAIYLSTRKSVLSSSRLYRSVSPILCVSIFGWGAINLVLAGARVAHATYETDFPGYIAQHGEYRRVNAEAIARMPYFYCPMGSSISIFEPTVWGREFLTHLVEGRGFMASTPGYPRNRDAETDQNPRQVETNCVLANRKYFDANSLPIQPSNNPLDFMVASPGNHFAALLALEGGYGVELDRETASRYVWTGPQDVRLTLLARASDYVVALRLCPGIARGPNEALTIFVEVDGKLVSQHKVWQCLDLDVRVLGDKQTKFQQLRISSVDALPGPTLIGRDPRDLRLRVEVSKIILKRQSIK